MSTEELTPWFDGDTKPARPGVYATAVPGQKFEKYAYWDGRLWYYQGPTVQIAQHLGTYHDASMGQHPWTSWFQDMRWRGLASDPNV